MDDNNDTQDIARHWREAEPDDRLAHLVKDASRAFSKSLQIRLARFGVPLGHWSFLRVLWASDGLTQKELSSRVGVMEPTTFAALRSMQELGYVVRRQLPDNRKNVYIHLTPKGRALKRKLVPLAEEVNRVGVNGLDSHEVCRAREILLAIIENLAADEAAEAPPSRRA